MLLGILIVLITAASCYLFLHPPAWFPHPISVDGLQFDRQFSRTGWTLATIFISAQLLLVWLIWRYSRNRRSVLVEGHRGLEIFWMLGASLVFGALALTGARTWGDTGIRVPADSVELIEVYAHQFAWSFRYPGPDGKFGRSSVKFVNDAAGNPMGIDAADPAGRDDFVSASLHVPVDREIWLVLHSRDVIHDFFVRELRLKQDVVPGMEIPYRFRANRVGRYEVACSELCGIGHHQMRSVLEVMPQADYTRWKLSRPLTK
ncbi:MAG: cytochrome c oxidase subunit II [Terriglobales bacterium]